MQGKILPLDFPGLEERIYAGFWRRFGAFWLDILITAPIAFGIAYINNIDRLNAIYTLIPSQAFFSHIIFISLNFGGRHRVN